MKFYTLALSFILSSLVALHAQPHPIQPDPPAISLFESTDIIREFLKKEAKYDYSKMRLTQVSLKYVEGHPRKGEAWIYFFNHLTFTLGGELSIYHYMDGEIIELQNGP